MQAVLKVEHTFGMARVFQKELEKHHGTGKQKSGATAEEAAAESGGTLSGLEERGQVEAERDAGADAGRERRGRVEPAPKTDTPEFKGWFRESKVVDENGDPLRLYHGTTRKNPKILRQSFESGNGILLTDNDDVASTFTLPQEYARQGAWFTN